MASKRKLLELDRQAGEDRYVIDRSRDGVLGSGSFASVHLGVQPSASRLVAAKNINLDKSGGVEEVAKEIDVLKQLPAHQHIVRLLYSEVHDWKNTWWVVLEYCELGDLEHYYDTYEPSELITVEIMSQIATAIAFMHNQYNPIMHRDLKPQNIIMAKGHHRRAVAKISDFGLAKVNLDSCTTIRAVTQAGTESFLAPEIFENLEYNRAVDIFSAGLIFLGMIKFHADGNLYVTACAEGVPAYLRRESVGRMLIQMNAMNMKTPDLAAPRDKDPPVFITIKDTIRPMISLDPENRPKPRSVDYDLRQIFRSIEDDLGESPGMSKVTTLSPALEAEFPHLAEDAETKPITEDTVGYERLTSTIKKLAISSDDKLIDTLRRTAHTLIPAAPSTKAPRQAPRLPELPRAKRRERMEEAFEIGYIAQLTFDERKMRHYQSHLEDVSPETLLHLGMRGFVKEIREDYILITSVLGTKAWHTSLLHPVDLRAATLEAGDCVMLDSSDMKRLNEKCKGRGRTWKGNLLDLKGEIGVVYKVRGREVVVEFPGPTLIFDEAVVKLISKHSECTVLVERMMGRLR